MSIFADAREKGKVREGEGKREGGGGGGQCNGLKSQNNHSHLFAHYEWFEPRNNNISKRNVILIRAECSLGDLSFDNICTDTLPLNWYITSAFSINKAQVLTTFALVRATSVNANVKLIRAIE